MGDLDLDAIKARHHKSTPPTFEWSVYGSVMEAAPPLARLRAEKVSDISSECTLRPNERTTSDPGVNFTVHCEPGQDIGEETREVMSGIYWSWWRKASGAHEARTDVLALIAEVERLRRLEAWLEAWEKDPDMQLKGNDVDLGIRIALKQAREAMKAPRKKDRKVAI